MITLAQRERFVANLEWMYANGRWFAYFQTRPFKIRSRATLAADFADGIPVPDYDCFAFQCDACYVSGLKDPGGFDFTGDGDTASTLAHLPDHYTDPARALLGAFVIFGADLPDDRQHMCAVVGAVGTDNPELIGHGQPGVIRNTLAEEQTAHAGSTVFLSPSPLG